MTDAERWLREHRAEAHWASGQVAVFAGRVFGVGRDLAEAVRNARVNAELDRPRWRRAPALAEPVGEEAAAWLN